MSAKLTSLTRDIYNRTVLTKRIAALTGGTSAVEACVVTAGGTGYSDSFAVSFSGGGGSGAAGTATAVDGIVVAVDITAVGSGYTSAPTPDFTAGGGSSATGTAILSALALDAIPTVDVEAGTLLLALAFSGTAYLYKLTAGTDAESSPSVIRPDDYAGGTNEKVWILQGIILGELTISKAQNAQTLLTIINAISLGNTSAAAGVEIESKDSSGQAIAFPSDYSVAGFRDKLGLIANSDAAGLFLRAGAGGGIIEFMVNAAAAADWTILSTGVFESAGAQTIRTATGNLTLATAAGNGHILLSPNGSGQIGINTSPSALVHAKRDQNATTESRIENATANTASLATFRAVSDAASNAAVFGAAAAAYAGVALYAGKAFWQAGSGTVGMVYDARGTALIQWAFAGTEFMRLTSGGLAIGTLAAPTALLHIKAGTATANTAPIKLTSGTKLTTIENGAMEFDGDHLYFSKVGIRERLSGVLFTITSTNGPNNTATETTLLTGVQGTLTLPANFFVAGKTIRLKLRGWWDSDALATLDIKVKLGSTTVLDTGAITPTGSFTGFGWEMDALITCRTTGGTGTVFCQGSVKLENAAAPAGAEYFSMPTIAATTIDTTASLAIDATAQWGSAGAGRNFNCTNAVGEILN